MQQSNILLLLLLPLARCYLPVVLWHGMGDSYYGMEGIAKMINDTHPGTYTHAIMIGSNVVEDTEAGFYGNLNSQISDVCAKLKADPKLAKGFHAIGFSQGGQFMRAVVQRCGGELIVRSLISVGGQQQGVFGLPPCPSSGEFLCEQIRRLLNHAAYHGAVQKRLVQAQYWHDPLNEDLYKAASIFLADINQENSVNETYKANILQLDNLVLVKFNQDQMVIPRESSHFGFFTPGQDVKITPLENSTLYTEDRLGLAQLAAWGQLTFLDTDGGHLQFTKEWFTDHITNTFLD